MIISPNEGLPYLMKYKPESVLPNGPFQDLVQLNDPLFRHVKFLMPFEGQSGSNTNINKNLATGVSGISFTAVGGVIFRQSAPFGGTACHFESGGYFSSSQTTPFAVLNDTTASWDFWIKPGAPNGSNQIIAQAGWYSGLRDPNWALVIDTNHNLIIGLANGGGAAGAQWIYIGGTLYQGVWSHIAIQKYNKIIYGYVNGKKTCNTLITKSLGAPQYGATIGYAVSLWNPFTGALKDFRFTTGGGPRFNGDFTPTKKASIFRGGATFVPTYNSSLIKTKYSGAVFINKFKSYDIYRDKVVLLISGENSISDKTNKSITVNGNTQISESIQPIYANNSIKFDGTDDYLTIASHADFNFGTADFTIEFWMYIASLEDTQIIDMRPASTNGYYPAISCGSDGSLTYHMNSFNVISASAGTIVANKWYHLALSKVNGDSRLFLNGKQVGSTWNDSNTLPQGRVLIGSNSIVPTTYDLNGYLKDIRITKGIGRYISRFNVNTTPFSYEKE